MPSRKPQLICDIECPYCKKPIKLFKEVEIITPSEPAVKRVIWTASKDRQRTL